MKQFVHKLPHIQAAKKSLALRKCLFFYYLIGKINLENKENLSTRAKKKKCMSTNFSSFLILLFDFTQIPV